MLVSISAWTRMRWRRGYRSQFGSTRPASLIRSNATKMTKTHAHPRRQCVVTLKDVNPGQFTALKAVFALYFLAPAGPSLAAHGSPKIQLTFPATRPSRTIPSLKSDIRKTGGGGGERRWIQPDLCSGSTIAGAAPQPRCDARVRCQLVIWPDYRFLRRQPSLGDTPLVVVVMQKSRTSVWGRGEMSHQQTIQSRVSLLWFNAPRLITLSNQNHGCLSPAHLTCYVPHSRDNFQPYSREIFCVCGIWKHWFDFHI